MLVALLGLVKPLAPLAPVVSSSARCCLLPRLLLPSSRRFNSNRASVVRTARNVYPRPYTLLLARPDGSTVRIRYLEPKKIIMLPVDLDALSEEEKLARLRARGGRKERPKSSAEDDLGDELHTDTYSKFWRKK
uniref:39S ribosomal protein L55, mitochondrial n=1 Tax=Petromyzon marinus TaxID=7757 RepID=A0AAJ7X6S2_PETMA|nr:39S ribosomal protein L55, mitochondrial [Petromyzon marinus]